MRANFHLWVKMFSIYYKCKYGLISGVILFVFSNNVYSQERKNNQKFVHYSTRNGLSSREQTNIVQDQEGFIWIGTTDGLNRFDGHEFKVYRQIPGDSTSLGSNEISGLFIDSYGTLWVGTYSGGVCRYNKEFDNFSILKNEQGDNITVSSNIVEDNQHRLWLSTYLGLYLFDLEKGRFNKTFYFEPGNEKRSLLASNQVRALYVEGETIWIGYGAGIFSSVNTKTMLFKHFKLPGIDSKNTTDNFINSFCSDGDSLWMTTWGKGTWIFNKKTQVSYPYNGIKSLQVNFICKDKPGNIWIGTESDGLAFLDKERRSPIYYVHNVYNKNSLSNNCVSNIFIDRQNNLWLSNKRGDVHYFIVDNPFRIWIRDPGNATELSNNNITCMLETNEGNLWVGFMEGGIDIINLKSGSKRVLGGPDDKSNLGKNTVITMFKDRDKELWLGTYMGGLKKYNKNSDKFVTYLNNPLDSNSLSGNDIRKIAEDSKGNLWLAVHGGGLNKFNKKTGKCERFLVNYKNLGSSPVLTNWLSTVLCDKHDNIWVGTISGASFLSNDFKTIRHFENNTNDTGSLSNDNINVIFEDSKGDIWLGTYNGLNHYNKGTGNFTRYSVKNGLPNNIILAITEDNNNNLWIATNKGLSKFSPTERLFRNYSTDDGLITDEFNNGSCYKNSRGELYFGGLEGLFAFFPDSLKTNAFVPPVYITDFKLFNKSVINKNDDENMFVLEKPINQCKKITLNYSQNIIGFEFVALNYINQQKNLYSYKMEGFDESWSLPDTKRDVTYTNLHYGTYTFKVKACNNDGIWNETGASIQIIITPPFWKTNWAFIFYLLFIAFLLYIFRSLILYDANIKRKLAVEIMEVEKLQELDSQKMKFFSNISHEFRTPLTLILGPLDKLIHTIKDEHQLIDIHIIHRNAQRLLRLINQLMDFRKIEAIGFEVNYVKGDIIKFITDLCNVFLYEASQRNIKFSIKTDINSLSIYFDKDKLDKILYNLLSNAFKFTPDSGTITVSVCTDIDMRNLYLTVEDSGQGIPDYAQSRIFERFYQVDNIGSYGTGIGLALTKELVQLLNGSIGVESAMGKGSKFTITFPVIQQIEVSKTKGLISEQNIKEREELSKWSYQDIQNSQIIPDEEAHHKKDLPILLIVEDNADMRLFIRNEFINSYRVLEAANGELGFEKAITEIPDIIICDVMMPVMDGIELCEKIKSDEKTSHIPVVLLTALSSDEDTVEGLKCGADDYIIKPFNSIILKLKIRNIVESRKLFQSRFSNEPSATINEIALSVLDEKFLKKAYEVVEMNIDNAELDVNDFTQAIGMSRAQVYRKIHALTGQSVKEFIRIIRLKKAAEMLLNDNKNITETAFAVGFNSIAYFTKSFTDYFGVSPSKYIHLHK
jgi:signal transduction histidine kinase/ligand-binding sensor domain-containing protein/DNA-binding response OmpR family regulator